MFISFFLRILFPKKPIVLLYHDIFSNDNIYKDSVTINGFDNQLNFLNKYFNICNFSDFDQIKDLKRSFLSRPSVMITFDDGYENNFTNAYPLLKKYNIPAIIFANTIHLDSKDILWFKLYKLYNKISNNSICISNLKQQDNQPFSLYKRNFDEFIIDQKKADNYNYFLEYTSGLKVNQIVEMDKSGLVEFGLHTHSHPIITRVNDNETLINEWKKNYMLLDKYVTKKIRLAAYPNGEFDMRNINVLTNININNCFSVNKYISNIPQRFQYQRVGIYSNSMFKFFGKLLLYGKI
jgi:peptidoglycan/xylan/chitin deacetylase (PgdA/CDA1 family)